MRKIILILVILFCFISGSSRLNTINKNIEYCCDTSFLTSSTLNDSILYLALLHYEIKNPEIVLAQAKLESGNFTSNVYKTKNNFLGLYNSRRKEYFSFKHWTECIQGYKNMIEYKLGDEEDYYDFLARIGYAEDPAYIEKVKKIEQKITEKL